MVNFSIAANNQQASASYAADELAALPSYASAGHDVMARALELTKAWLPDSVQYSVDAILYANAKNGTRQEAGAA